MQSETVKIGAIHPEESLKEHLYIKKNPIKIYFLKQIKHTAGIL